MTKHTPGPWAVNPITAQVDAFVDGKPLAVCQLLWPTDERTEAETEANARLISAAPDLLEATEGLLEELRLIRLKDTDAVYDPSIRVLARAAIAKARKP